MNSVLFRVNKQSGEIFFCCQYRKLRYYCFSLTERGLWFKQLVVLSGSASNLSAENFRARKTLEKPRKTLLHLKAATRKTLITLNIGKRKLLMKDMSCDQPWSKNEEIRRSFEWQLFACFLRSSILTLFRKMLQKTSPSRARILKTHFRPFFIIVEQTESSKEENEEEFQPYRSGNITILAVLLFIYRPRSIIVSLQWRFSQPLLPRFRL